ncbi:cellular nucleic acid-binding protein, partial [Trifolium medium]|nr:cellular nucleic acid-binding protein [Trifolium medium]
VKFETLCAFSPHYNTLEAEDGKCVKFESGLRPDIKHMIEFSQIRDFATLVNKSRICDDDGRAKVNYYKAANERKGKGQEHGKPYDNRGRGNTSGGRKPVNG